MPPFYSFQPPTQILNYHAQLQEWADKNHVLLDWQLLVPEYSNGALIHAVYPVVAGNRVSWAVGRGRQLKQAKESAAEMLINTPGALNTALGYR